MAISSYPRNFFAHSFVSGIEIHRIAEIQLWDSIQFSSFQVVLQVGVEVHTDAHKWAFFTETHALRPIVPLTGPWWSSYTSPLFLKL